MHLYQSAMGSLAQRFQAKGGERGLNGVGMAAGCAQPPGRALKCVQPGLAQLLSLILQPVVIPVGQQVADQVGQIHRVQVNGLRGPRVGELAREYGQVADIYLDIGTELEKRRSGGDHALAGLIDPP